MTMEQAVELKHLKLGEFSVIIEIIIASPLGVETHASHNGIIAD